jgi:hypothetical protein
MDSIIDGSFRPNCFGPPIRSILGHRTEPSLLSNQSTVPQDARRAATAVLLKDKSMPRLMHSVEGFLEDKLQKT